MKWLNKRRTVWILTPFAERLLAAAVVIALATGFACGWEGWR